MTNRELMIRALTQMIAPRLFVLSGDNPEDMGFPFADDEEAFEEWLKRQFDPVTFWTEKASEIAEAVVDVIYPEGDVPEVTDALIERSADFAEKWRPTGVSPEGRKS